VRDSDLHRALGVHCRADGRPHPEYLGKKIEAYDVKMAMLVTLIFPTVILVFAAISTVATFGTSSVLNAGPHGLSEILYSFVSQAGNNGSAFAGLTTNSFGTTPLVGSPCSSVVS
jgi:K+-transporting ATPase ATPase A chain